MSAELDRLIEQIDEAQDFVRRHCGVENSQVLSATSVDAAGTVRAILPNAWRNERNWRLLRASQEFESGASGLEPLGRPCFSEEQVTEVCRRLMVQSFLLEGEQVDLRDISFTVGSSSGESRPEDDRRQLSAASWFRGSGRALAEKRIRDDDGTISEHRVYQVAVELFEQQFGIRVTPGAFKAAAGRARRKGTPDCKKGTAPG